MKIPYWPLLLGPSMLFGLGFVLNAVVIVANHGQMPVMYPGGSMGTSYEPDDVHCAMTAATHLKFLADWILINGVGIASPGDFLEWAYDALILPCLYLWIGFVIYDSNRNRNHRRDRETE